MSKVTNFPARESMLATVHELHPSGAGARAGAVRTRTGQGPCVVIELERARRRFSRGIVLHPDLPPEGNAA